MIKPPLLKRTSVNWFASRYGIAGIKVQGKTAALERRASDEALLFLNLLLDGIRKQLATITGRVEGKGKYNNRVTAERVLERLIRHHAS